MNEVNLTKEAIAAYNEAPDHCPYCGSIQITADSFYEGGQEVTCHDCGEQWEDLYEFKGIGGV